MSNATTPEVCTPNRKLPKGGSGTALPVALRSTSRERGINVGSEYTEEEAAFLHLVDRWKREARSPHPTAIDLLRLAKWFLASRAEA